MYKNLDKKFTENWMHLSKEHIQDVRLVDLKIPGSHNSNTYSLKAFGNSFAQNQIWDIEKQLCQGIRSLDLRYGLNKDKTRIIDKHGPIGGKNFFESIKQIKKFLEFHPNEFIIMKVQAESVLSEEQKSTFITILLKNLEKYLITANDTWFEIGKVTLKQIWETNKRIFMVCSDYLTHFKDSDEHGFFLARKHYFSTWHDTDSRKELFHLNKEILMARKKDHADKLFVSEMILTTQRSATQIFKRLFSFGLPTIENMVQRINQKNQVFKFIIQNSKQPFNIILLDRIDFDPLIVLVIIILNMKSKLQIIQAFYKDEDITDIFQQCVIDDKFMYIKNIQYLLKKKIDEQRYFNIIYRYENSQNMLIQKNNISKTFMIFDNPLVTQEYANMNAFVLFIQGKTVFSKYFNIENEKQEEDVMKEFQQQYIKEPAQLALYSRNQSLIEFENVIKQK